MRSLRPIGDGCIMASAVIRRNRGEFILMQNFGGELEI